MKTNTTTPNVAEEYGYLDAKHNMGYEPRPSGFEAEYRKGYESVRRIEAPAPIPVGRIGGGISHENTK